MGEGMLRTGGTPYPAGGVDILDRCVKDRGGVGQEAREPLAQRMA